WPSITRPERLPAIPVEPGRHVNSRPQPPSAQVARLPVRIITLNVNGIRSAERKGFARWLGRVEPWDVVCVQEIKAGHDDIPRSLRSPRKAHAAFLPATKKGYAGVGLYARKPPAIAHGFGIPEFDAEGRYIEARFDELSVISLYLPSGSS